MPARGNHRLVRRIEFIELADQSIGHGEGGRFVEHKVAQKGVEIAEILGRLGLVQQAQGHLAVDTEQAAKALGVGAELAAVKGVGKALFEFAHIQIGLSEHLQFAEFEGALEDHEMALHVAGVVGAAAQPQDLRQNHVPIQIIAVGQRQGRPARSGAQVARGDLARGIVLLLRPGAADITHQVAVTPGLVRLARRGVKIDPARRHQQRREGVEQGRFARAGAAHKQKALLLDRDIVHAREGAPIEDLKPGHAELFRRIRRKEVVRFGNRAHSRPAADGCSSSGTDAAPGACRSR